VDEEYLGRRRIFEREEEDVFTI